MVCDNQDGWQLDEMDWDPETGLSTFQYIKMTGKIVERKTEVRQQPYSPDHLGWAQLWNQEQGVFTV
jgi:hypothetical protein